MVVDNRDTLHGRAGRYINSLRQSGQMGEHSAQIAKSATQIFEQFDHIRNNQSLARDSQMLALVERKYVFETVLSLLRFIKVLDEAQFDR